MSLMGGGGVGISNLLLRDPARRLFARAQLRDGRGA